jgi:hypothetical protein
MRSDPNMNFSKKSYYRKQSVEKLYKLIKRKVLIDMRTVKRFRIWQILVLKRKIAIFMRKVKETNKRFLHRNLKVIMQVLKKPIRETFNKLYNSDLKVQIPRFLYPQVSICKLLSISLKLIAKSQCSSFLSLVFLPKDLKKKVFGLWKSRTYQASPFLHRNYVLALNCMGIVLRHTWRNLNYAWQKVNRMRHRVETIALIKSIKKIFLKKISWAFRKVSQPRFNRRKIEKPKFEAKGIDKQLKASSILLEMMIRKKKGIENKELDIKVAKFFNSWKMICLENSVPNFIMKRHYRNWGIKILTSGLKSLTNKKKFIIFSELKNLKASKAVFQIDHAIVQNQATILVKLESQHYSKLKELKIIKHLQTLNKCKITFNTSLCKWLIRWKKCLKAPENLEVLHI